MGRFLVLVVPAVLAVFTPPLFAQITPIETPQLKIEILGQPSVLWRYFCKDSGQSFDVSAPRFEIDGRDVTAALANMKAIGTPKTLPNGVSEYRYSGVFRSDPTLSLELVFRVPAANPVVRFQYRLVSVTEHKLTKQKGKDNFEYLSVSLSRYPDVAEIRLSEFYELPHTYKPSDVPVLPRDFENAQRLIGPILIATNSADSLLFAYEHGSQIPDAYVNYELKPSKAASLTAVKGNYYSGQRVEAAHPYATIWMEIGAVKGTRSAAMQAFRTFMLRHQALYPESRKPYIFYNTWNFQERNHDWKKGKYLDTMNLDRMLTEIDAAHRLGIEVFVVDAGWFSKTGDWTVDSARFPDGLKKVKARLDEHRMRLGLWFTSKAAVSSRMLESNRDCIMTTNSKAHDPADVWETEQSYDMCMVSRFGDAFADELVRLGKELGVRYFKWDAFDQYGCNDPGHWHGTDANTPEERSQSYSFQIPEQMARVAEKISAALPDSIVDFDITEGERAVGLRFLAAGKYYIINNGPYYYSLDDPLMAPGGGLGANVLVFPGLARAANARVVLDYDRWVPSVLFMTHYLSDDPEYSQWINLGSLILGQNGIWGDLPAVSKEGVKRFAETLSKYKQVRDDISAAYPARSGEIGGTPEIHEKINPETGKGAVVIFYNYRNAWRQKEPYFPASFRYVTRLPVVKESWHNGVTVAGYDSKGRAILEGKFDGPGAKIILFGAK